MQVFVIHRSESRRAALALVKETSRSLDISLRPIILKQSHGEEWKADAVSAMRRCEAVIVADVGASVESQNCAWEIEQARTLGKPLILLNPADTDQAAAKKLFALYHHVDEFDSYFAAGGADTAKMHEMMAASSEELIQRRQRMNAFFITAIGALLAIAGALAKFGAAGSRALTFPIIAALGFTGLLLCNSWSKLIDNYGKLNAAKFRVILRLEESLSAQIFAAEWAALGKGLRPKKYQSFTATERRVPLWFALLIAALMLSAAVWRVMG